MEAISPIQVTLPSTTAALKPAFPLGLPLVTAPPAHIVASSSAHVAGSNQEAAIRSAASSFKDFYALGDTEFSLFKDADGKYITRYFSLRDGTVTYVPEPVLIRHALAVADKGGQINIRA